MEATMMPVFRVMKGGRVLKNIFLNEPPEEEGSQKQREGEEKILVGRHPDCHIVVDHPSISRFHIQICVQVSSRRISVVDLSSVHGTWISGKKLRPQVPVDLSEGERMRIGGSSRIYELHWIPSPTEFEPKISTPALSEGRSQIDTSTIEEDSTALGAWGLQIPSAPPIPQAMKSVSPHSVSAGKNQIQELQSSEEAVLHEDPIRSESTASEQHAASTQPGGNGNGNATQGVLYQTSPPRSANPVASSSLLSRRCKSFSVLRVHTGRSRERARASPAIDQVRKTEEEEEENLCKALFTGLDTGERDGVCEERLLLNKENMTPEAFRSNPKVTKKLMIDLLQKSEEEDDDDDDDDDGAFYSDKENCTPHLPGREKEGRPTGKPSKSELSESRRRLEDEIVKRRVSRIPFQSLIEYPLNAISPLGKTPITQRLKENSAVMNQTAATENSAGDGALEDGKSSSDVSSSAGDRMKPRTAAPRRMWNMVVDTSCFLDEESRKALRLLEGVRGTHLIVPSMVIRELDCQRRRESLFRKTPKVSPVLQWIEECMVKSSGWIHVQSSMETIPPAPTPPAAAAAAGLAEILSPTADDHILDCAFLFRQKKNDGQLVLLTNEVSLKIKAMAEGLLCESPKEFRESLVSPWSERFLWAESSPRGPTWSTADALGPMDSCPHGHYPNPCAAARRPAKGMMTASTADGARGLKLILLHNSLYAQPSPIIR